MSSAKPPIAPLSSGEARPILARLPVVFETNAGQAPKPARYLARAGTYVALFEAGQVELIPRTAGPDRLRLRLVGSREVVEPEGLDRLPSRVSYLRGRDRSAWRSGLPTFRKVTYPDAYSRTDLVFYGRGSNLECDFVVRPGGDPGRIAFAIENARDLRLLPNGDLEARATTGTLRLRKPTVYQRRDDGTNQPVEGRYVLGASNRVGFALGPRDESRPVVIDPIIEFSTFLGGEDADFPIGIGQDADGNIYVGGMTYSTQFPTTPGAFDQLCGNLGCSSDAFVTKLDPTGTSLLYSTYLGGDDQEYARAFTVDPQGNAYLVGMTYSPEFPVTPGSHRTTFTPSAVLGNDGFVTKLDPNGASLAYSTFIDGDVMAVAVDAQGRAWVAGNTTSSTFPVTPGAFQSSAGGGGDVFVAGLSASGANLVYSTYFGGSGADGATGVALGQAGHVHVIGTTYSIDLPLTPAAPQATFAGAHDSFVAKFDPAQAGSASLAYSTYLGGSSFDRAEGIAIDASGRAVVVGNTRSTDFPTSNPYQATCSACSSTAADAFVTRLSANGSELLSSSYFGGSLNDRFTSVAIDRSGMLYVAGSTESANFPLRRTAPAGEDDILVARIDPARPGSRSLLWSTTIGGGLNSLFKDEVARKIALDRRGDIYLTGETDSTDFPTRNAVDGITNFTWEGVVVKLRNAPPKPLGDIDGDGIWDLAWRNAVSGANYAWLIEGGSVTSQGALPGVASTDWLIAGTADFDGDGDGDLLWWNRVTGAVYLWRLSGTTVTSQEAVGTVPDTAWEIVGTGDHDGDGRADILWRHATLGDLYLWSMNGATSTRQDHVATVGDTGWRIISSADFDGDGRSDLLWRHGSTGAIYLWRMSGPVATSQSYVGTVPLDWQVAGTGDGDGDGLADLVWRNAATGVVYVWRMDGHTTLEQGYLGSVPDTDWQIAGTGDYDGDGRADLLWWNQASGIVYVWRIDGFTVLATTYLGTVPDTSWRPVPSS